jgi:hypothetical protein
MSAPQRSEAITRSTLPLASPAVTIGGLDAVDSGRSRNTFDSGLLRICRPRSFKNPNFGLGSSEAFPSTATLDFVGFFSWSQRSRDNNSAFPNLPSKMTKLAMRSNAVLYADASCSWVAVGYAIKVYADIRLDTKS